MYRGSGYHFINAPLTPLVFIVSLTCGSTLLMWLAEQLSSKGIGNGTSMLIAAGIVSRLPSAGQYLYSIIVERGFVGGLIALAVLIGAILLVAGVVWVTEAERRIPIQYAKKVVGRKMYGGQSTHIPMKLAMAGVMPVIFAMSVLQLPAVILQLINHDIATSTGFWAGFYKVCAFTSLQTTGLWDSATGTFSWSVLGFGLLHILVYLLLILGFTWFWTNIVMFNPVEVANNLQKNGGFIPGIRAGKPTSDYLAVVLNKISLFGSIFLAIIAVLPILTQFVGLQISFGGTAILIVVGVALESVRQLESQMLIRHYKGFLE